jgi:lipoprotein NlpD
MNQKKIMLAVRMIFAGAVISLVVACSSTPNNAPVVERASRGTEVVKPTVVAAPIQTKPVIDLRTSYVVKKGDTLFRIALDHGQSYSDIVAWNSLKNPNDIKVDQVLRVAPLDASANGAVQTASVTSGVASEIKSALPVSVNLSVNKTSPKGDKRIYSDASLAELQKADGVVAPVPVPAVKTDLVVKPVEKAASPAAPESDAIDWIWPTEGRVVANFDDAKNKGLDIAGKLGQDVLAAGAGKVMYEGSGIRGYGNLVIIKHSNSILSAYAHNKINLVKEGQSISRGQKIAEMGNSDSDAIKLHFEIRQQGKPVDPSKFLPAR